MSDHSIILTDQSPGRTLPVNGEEYLFFSGTSYLGIPHNRQFRELLLEGMGRYGSNYSSSRKSNLHLQVYEVAENYLAAYTGAEAAITMSSGFLAAQTLVQTLQGTGHFCYAPGTHPALWRTSADGAAHVSEFGQWKDQLLQVAGNLPGEHLVIVCNSLDPLRAKRYSFDWVTQLPESKKITLIIDDSHGFGITGASGAGIYRELKDKMTGSSSLVVVSSLGKAFGIPAGLIAGDTQLIEKLHNSTYFAGASPAMPAFLYAFLKAGKLFEEARQLLLSNINFFRQSQEESHLFRHIHHYPVFFTEHQRLYYFLLKHRIVISCFPYPTPSDDPVTRIVLSSLHTHQDLQYLAKWIKIFAEDQE